MRSPIAIWTSLAITVAIGFVIGFYRIGGPAFEPLLYVVMAWNLVFGLAMVVMRRRLLRKQPLPRWAQWVFERDRNRVERP